MLFVCYIDLESNNLLDCFIVSNASSILLDFLHGQLYHLQIKFSFFFFSITYTFTTFVCIPKQYSLEGYLLKNSHIHVFMLYLFCF